MSKLVTMTLAVPDRTGASRMQSYFARALLDRGHRVRLLHGAPATDDAGAEWSLLADQREAGVETVELPILRRPVPYLSYGQIARAAKGSDAIVAVNQRDRAAAMAAAARLRIPGVVAAQNQHNFWGRALLPRLKHAYYGNRLRKGLSLAVCTSEIVREQLIELFGIDASKCVTLPNGIPVSENSIDRSNRSDAIVRYVSVGRLDQQKGYDVLIDAWDRAGLTGKAELRIVGGITPGNSEAMSRAHAESLERQIAERGLGNEVFLEGSRDNVPEYLVNADVYVHSARWEGPALPLAIMEAMDKALPVVMTDCSGWPDGFVAGRDGYVVPAEDAPSLADALANTVGLTVAERNTMGQSSRQLLLDKYDIAKIGVRFAELIEENMS